MLGGVSRYGMTLVTQNYAALALPFGTLISNIAGCLLIGLIAGIGASSQVLSSLGRSGALSCRRGSTHSWG